MLAHFAEWEPSGFLVKKVETSAPEDQAERAVVICPSTVNLLQLLFCEYILAQIHLLFSSSMLFSRSHFVFLSAFVNAESEEKKDSKYFKDRANSSEEERYWKKDSIKDKEWFKKS